MVGFVREIHAKQGQTVAAGDRVVTMEAMKMDIYVVAPVSGIVGPVLVSPGDTVGEGAVLLTIAVPEGS